MRGQDLLEAMELMDERFVEEADKPLKRRYPLWMRAVSVAACVCLLLGGVSGVLWWQDRQSAPKSDLITLPQEGKLPSTVYSSFDEYLEAMSTDEAHNLRGDGFSLSPSKKDPDEKLVEGQNAVTVGSCAYYVGQEGVMISDLSKETLTSETALEGYQRYLFYSASGNSLITVGQETRKDENNKDDYVTKVSVYTLATPDQPLRRHVWEQRGRLSAAYMVGGELVLMTTDGQCACGWSRLKDTADYKPCLSVNEQQQPWGEEQLSILGAPERVQYLAVSRINTVTAAVSDYHAFYGNIQDVWYGADWMALSCYGESDWIYTYDVEDTITCTGTIDMPDKASASVWIDSVSRSGDVYRVIGTYRTGRGGHTNVQLLAMTANMKKATLRYELLGFEESTVFRIEDTVWEKDRAVVEAELFNTARFLSAEFRGMSIRLFVSTTDFENVNSSSSALIPMGKGLYLRCNSAGNGLHIFDLSRSRSPSCVYRADEPLVEEGQTLNFVWHVYNESTFGIAVMPQDRYNAPVQWQIYRIDPRAEDPFTLLSSTDIGDLYTSWDNNSADFAIWQYQGQHFAVTWSMDAPVRVDIHN